MPVVDKEANHGTGDKGLRARATLATAPGARVAKQNNCEALKRYTNLSYLSIDNTKNSGDAKAILVRVVTSPQHQGHDPFVYLRDVQSRLQGHAKEELADFLPDC